MYEDILEKGRETLSGYYDAWHETWPLRVMTEFKVDGIRLSDDVMVAGRLDRVEMLDQQGTVHVVDYKTKQPMSRNAIEGKTASSDDECV